MKADTNRLPHKCPNCFVTATTEQELKELFGYRRGDDKQSWCKTCRTIKLNNK